MKPIPNPKQRILILALILAVAIGGLRVWLAYQIEPYLGNGAGDFSFATRLSRDEADASQNTNQAL